MARLRIAPLLFSLLALIGVLGAASSLLGVLGLRNAGSQLLELQREEILPLAQLKRLSDAYAVNVVDAAHKRRNGGFTRQEASAALAAAEATIREDWARLNALPASAEEARLMRAAAERRPEADRLLAALRDAVDRDDAAALDSLVRERLYPVIDPLTEAVGALVDARSARSQPLPPRPGALPWCRSA